VIPLLALLPLFGVAGEGLHLDLRDAVVALTLVVAIVFLGRPVLRPLFRVIAETHSREIFTAFSLFLVIGVALLLNMVGMSLALGAFIGGVVLAESEYRHEVEIDVEPFKGLLMGLFFIAIGMSLDFALWLQTPWMVLGLVAALLAVKFAVMLVLAKSFGMHGHQSWLIAALLCQGGRIRLHHLRRGAARTAAAGGDGEPADGRDRLVDGVHTDRAARRRADHPAAPA
jgi:glutathione-regulated potassium-efflux system ancillary protein KefC